MRGLLLAVAPGDFAERFRLWISIVRLLLRILLCRSSSLLPLAGFHARLIFRSQDGLSLQILFAVDVTRRILPGGFMRLFLARGFRHILATKLCCAERNPDDAAEEFELRGTHQRAPGLDHSFSFAHTYQSRNYREDYAGLYRKILSLPGHVCNYLLQVGCGRTPRSGLARAR